MSIHNFKRKKKYIYIHEGRKWGERGRKGGREEQRRKAKGREGRKRNKKMSIHQSNFLPIVSGL